MTNFPYAMEYDEASSSLKTTNAKPSHVRDVSLWYEAFSCGCYL